MAAKKQSAPPAEVFPSLKTVEQMSKISGIGENKPPYRDLSILLMPFLGRFPSL